MPWATLIELAAKLLMYFLEKHKDNEKLREAFLNFIASIDQTLSVRVHNRYQEQLDQLKKKYEGQPTPEVK